MITTNPRPRWRTAIHCGILLLPVLVAFAATYARSKSPAEGKEDLFAGGLVPKLQIEIPTAGMEILRNYVWDKSLNGQDRSNVLATVREGNTVYTNVAIHLKGGLGSFRPVDDKPGLTLAFDKAASGQKFHGLSKIYLNNSVQDPSYLSEKICREMFLAAGIPSPRVGHAVVTLNGRRLGLYLLVEGWNKQFLKRHFPDANGNLYDGGYGNDVTNRLEINSGAFPDDWSHLEALGRAAHEPDLNLRLARMGESLDLDRFITFMAMEIMLAHWDGYTMNRNNFRIFDDRGLGPFNLFAPWNGSDVWRLSLHSGQHDYAAYEVPGLSGRHRSAGRPDALLRADGPTPHQRLQGGGSHQSGPATRRGTPPGPGP